MRLQPETEHPHGLPDAEFDALFTPDRPVIFAYHGYPWLIHRLTYRRANHAQPPRARLQGGGHDHDAVRHGHAQRHGPLPPRDGRDRPRARASARARGRCARRWSTSGCGCAATRATTATTRPRCATGRCRPAPDRRARPHVNTGSSSVKLRLLGPDDALLAEHEADAPGTDVDAAALGAALAELGAADAVAHRIVHGGGAPPRRASTPRSSPSSTR